MTRRAHRRKAARRLDILRVDCGGMIEVQRTFCMHAYNGICLASAMLVFGLPVAVSTLAAAEEFESRTTSIADKVCKTVSRLRVGSSQLASARICPGRGGYVVLVSEDDLRETLSVLRDDKRMQADLIRLNKACCAPRKLAALDGAPLPILVNAEPCPC